MADLPALVAFLTAPATPATRCGGLRAFTRNVTFLTTLVTFLTAPATPATRCGGLGAITRNVTF